MTGKYPINTGMGHSVLSGNDPWGLPLKYKIMPEHLKKVGLNEPIDARQD